VPPRALFYNLFACSACRFTDGDALGNAYLFNSSAASLAAVGSTKVGGMLVFDRFYGPLGEGKSIGQAFKEWLDALAPYSSSEVYWHYGMVLLGDPLAVPAPSSSAAALTIDMRVRVEGRLNPNGPACRSLGVVGMDGGGNPPETLYAIRAGGDAAGTWLRVVNSGAPENRDDLLADGAAPEWHTAAEWAGKRLRGLLPGTSYTFWAKAQSEAEAGHLVEVGAYATNADRDCWRDGRVGVVDLVTVRDASISGARIGTTAKPWPTDIDDSGETSADDVALIRQHILGVE